MMTRKFRLFQICIIVFFSCFIQPLSAAQNKTNWTIGAQRFSFSRNQTGSVVDGIAVMFPTRILEKLSSNLYRTIKVDENANRELYKIRQERNSLFLQLSAAIKKRDSLVLQNLSQSELERKISQEEIKVNEIKDKLNENLERQRELNSIIEESLASQFDDSQNAEKNTFLKSFFVQTSSPQNVSEKITLYKQDISSLFTPSGNAVPGTTEFEKQVVSANINCLITGQITAYDEYLSVTVYAHVYPGSKEIAVITEIGSVDDAQFITESIARQLAPSITNSMPSVLIINVEPYQALQNLNIYIDDVLYKDINSEFTVDSGVHFIQFTSQGFKNAGTNYYFEGNKRYQIDVNLQQVEDGIVFLRPASFLEGKFIANGLPSVKLEDNTDRIKVNGNAVLAQFITEEKGSAFLYIPEKKIEDGALYTAKIKPAFSKDFIEKRRRGMYLSYSMLVTSLMPTIVVKGIANKYLKLFEDKKTLENINNLEQVGAKAQNWVLASNVFTGISLACGIWFGFELFRYFRAADSVLPVNTSITFDYNPAPEAVEIVEEAVAQDDAASEQDGAFAQDETPPADKTTAEDSSPENELSPEL